MGIDIDNETKFLQRSKGVDPLPVEESSVAAAQPLLDSGGVLASLKVVKQSVPVRGILNLSMSVQPLLSLEVSAASSSFLVAKEVGAEGIPTLLSGCNTPNDEKGEDSKINGLIQSQKWSAGVGLDGEIVVWDHGDEIWNGEDGESPLPLGILHPDMPLDWAMDGVHGEDPSLAIMDAIEEEFHRERIIARQKTKGRRELLNLKSSINYDNASLHAVVLCAFCGFLFFFFFLLAWWFLCILLVYLGAPYTWF
jgi:hypothetical protein